MSRNVEPYVSVVITNYNYAEYVDQAIKSVLDQTYRNIKLIIIDDASSDGSQGVIKKYTKEASILLHKKNKGIVATRNEVLKKVSSKYLLFLDADDWIDATYVEELVKAAEVKQLDVAYCDAEYFSLNKADLDRRLDPPEFNVEVLKNKNFIHMSSLLRVEAFKDIEFDKKMENITHEDWDFFLNAAMSGLNISKVSGPSLNYRVKPNNRNMHLDDQIGFAQLYEYLFEKYEKQHPGTFSHLAYYRFAKSFLTTAEDLKETTKKLTSKILEVKILEKEIADIRNSKSYRIGRLLLLPLRVIKKVAKMALQEITLIKQNFHESPLAKNVRSAVFRFRNRSAEQEAYFISTKGEFKKTSDIAVILHLYYTENWHTTFKDRLSLLATDIPFDLYVTVPEKNVHFYETIALTHPSVNLLVVPNRGRDVLPFLKVAAMLKSNGYKKVLKIHSKKSTHRDLEGNAAESGGDWLNNTLDALIPEKAATRDELKRLLSLKTTGLIGARHYYYPLRMYFKNNRSKIEAMIHSLSLKKLGEISIAESVDKYGYFGGTMFWISLDSITGLFNISKKNFQKEQAQIDATTAHALERILCLLPQADGKLIYGTDKYQTLKLTEKSATFPDWYFDDISGGKPQISIIVPVYSDWSSLSKNINSLKKYYGNSEDISVHYVNDCGPEADDLEAKIKKSIEGLVNFYYYRNPTNLGFVKTCNRAVFELVNEDDDILLLNSDTKVTRNFAQEMRAVLYSEDLVGAVTSRSNNATIWSVPMTSKFANHRTLSRTLYLMMKHKLPSRYITPTIHGFCALIRREVIEKYGLFDEIYGKGYGEENDFAMRIRSHGWKSAVANYSYVFHYESRSFGNEVRNKQIEINEKILLERYPNYRQLVQEYWDSVKEPLK